MADSDDLQPGPKTRALISLLDRLIAGLSRPPTQFWADTLTRAVCLLRKGDFGGIEHVLGAYGGMGSFTDLILEDALDRLRSKVYALADEIRREAEIE